MRLNPDCIRDLLLYLEENLSISPDLEFLHIDVRQIGKSLNYPLNEIANTVLSLDDAGFIVADTFPVGDGRIGISISRITYSGYEFLELIRPENVWEKVKTTGKRIGSFSFGVIKQIATSALASFVSAQLNP